MDMKWIKTSERLPQRFEPVILCRPTKDGEPRVECGTMDVNGWWRIYGTRTKNVTHWMPLPPAPEDCET